MATNIRDMRSKAAQLREVQHGLEVVKVKGESKPKVVKHDTSSIPGKLRYACLPQNLLAMVCGSPFGGFAPLAAWWLAHKELPDYVNGSNWLLAGACVAFILGAMVFSAKTVYEWSYLAYKDKQKAIGYVVLLEGCMLLSKTPWLTITALVLLIIINLVSSGVTIAMGQKQVAAEE